MLNKIKMRKNFRKVAVLGLRASAPLRSLPNFIIIGTPKSGTTSLHAYLGQHPLVKNSLIKETYYLHPNNFKGIPLYRQFFPLRQWSYGAARITGEGSTTYFYDPQVAETISTYLPDTKLLLVLREPAERAISQYWHFVRHGRETRPIEEVFDYLFELYSSWRTGDPIPEVDPNRSASDYLKYSLYAEFLEPWLGFLHANTLRVIIFEEMIAAPDRIVQEALDWLDLATHSLSVQGKFNANTKRKTSDLQLIERLRHFFRADLINLRTHLNVPSDWIL